MKKELPNVFVNPLTKKLNNQREIFYGQEEEKEIKEDVNVLKKINQIFSSPNYIYKKRVSITLKDEEIDTSIIGHNNVYLLTNKNEKINIDDILDINEL